MARPPMPWVGNKEKLLPYIHSILPPKYSQYLEPFGGSGAVAMLNNNSKDNPRFILGASIEAKC